MSFVFLNLRRILMDKAGLFFSIALPIFFYIIFGATQSYGDQPLNSGNVNAYIMIGMALYAGAVGAIGGASTSVVEGVSGWNRQLALTPLTQGQLLASQLVPLIVRAALPVIAVYIAGVVGGAQMPLSTWIATGLITVAVSIPFGLYGIAWAQLLRSSTAISIASSSMVVLAFAGNILTPLPESFMDVVRFTPAYGAGALARYPLSDGMQAISGDPGTLTDPLIYAVVNVAAWAAIFGLAVVLLNRRDKTRI
ncbi:ABC transporter permease [Corynebacterium falsenii]|uniref:ABC transporter permease n=1 Tax=Corynebacterium falsenii TaxID=108486 RepID=UPI00234CC562|nr:ABC transporter permease [Corynebacterium falsenii]MDC7104825.1 ABC transporter permease [Corynebacterium falsenii]